MRCPYCGFAESKVIDSRPTEESNSIRRRRECLKCQKRFTTYEKLEAISLAVIKKDQSRQQYDRGKVLKGIITACEKRPISLSQMEQIADDIESELYQSMTVKRLWKSLKNLMKLLMYVLRLYTKVLMT